MFVSMFQCVCMVVFCEHSPLQILLWKKLNFSLCICSAEVHHPLPVSPIPLFSIRWTSNALYITVHQSSVEKKCLAFLKLASGMDPSHRQHIECVRHCKCISLIPPIWLAARQAFQWTCREEQRWSRTHECSPPVCEDEDTDRHLIIWRTCWGQCWDSSSMCGCYGCFMQVMSTICTLRSQLIHI